MRADKVDLSRRVRSARRALSQRPTKRAVKGSSLDGTLQPLPWKSAGGAKGRGAEVHVSGRGRGRGTDAAKHPDPNEAAAPRKRKRQPAAAVPGAAEY